MAPITKTFRITATIACLVAVYMLFFAAFDTFIFYGFPMIAGVVSALVLRRLDPRRTSADHLTDALRVFYGLHLIWSSSRYWFAGGQPAIPHPIGGPFIDSLIAMGLFPGIKAMEGLIGIVLLTNRFVPLALVLEVPTSFTIFYLNVFITGAPRQLITGPIELGVNCALLLAYFRYYKPLLTAHTYAAPPRCLGLSAIDKAEHPPGPAR